MQLRRNKKEKIQIKIIYMHCFRDFEGISRGKCMVLLGLTLLLLITKVYNSMGHSVCVDNTFQTLGVFVGAEATQMLFAQF